MVDVKRNKSRQFAPWAAVVVALLGGTGCEANSDAKAPTAVEQEVASGKPTPPSAPGHAVGVVPEVKPPRVPAKINSLPNGLLLAYAQFEIKDGKTVPKPQAARLELLIQRDGEWKTEVLEDADSNVFHKAMTYRDANGTESIVTLGGMQAMVKRWQRRNGKLVSETLWAEKFGGKWDRMRDGEIGDVYGDDRPTLVIATHDQGVVAALRPDASGKFSVTKLAGKANTFVHEIELGDIDGDGVMEVYATPSEPNKLEGGVQEGLVWRFVPKEAKGPEVVADLGNRHAKEILVDDVDGDGRDELYVAVEALTEGKGDSLRLVEPVEIRRFDADSDPSKGTVVATLPDRLCRFLTSGDVDGDGKKEMVAAAYRSGLWLLKPPAANDEAWQVENIDRHSSGFEHAAVLTDLDGDGADELYVAADEQGELRQYRWSDGAAQRQTIQSRKYPSSMMTWNIMPVPASLVVPGAHP